MKSPRRTCRPIRTHVLLTAVCVLAAGSAAALASSDADSPESFTWSAELVDRDEANMTITVKSLVVGDETHDWSAFGVGDRVMLTWSGITSGTGVRFISRDLTDLENARLTMPVEFVEKSGRYLTFRVAVPADEWHDIATLTPGQWVTATARVEASLDGAAVASIRPYTAVG